MSLGSAWVFLANQAGAEMERRERERDIEKNTRDGEVDLMSDAVTKFQRLSDADINKLFVAWVHTERSSQAELLELLGEVDARHLYAKEAAPSLFRWLRERFNFSDAGAYRRITVARKGRAFPALIDAIRAGRLHLTGASLLAAHLNQENCEDLIRRAERLSKNEIEEMLAIRFPGVLPKTPAHDCVKFMRGTEHWTDQGAESGQSREERCGRIAEGTESEGDEDGAEWALKGASTGNPAVRLCVTIDNDTYKTLVKLEELHPGESKGKLIGRALRLMHAKSDPEVRNAKTLARLEKVTEKKWEGCEEVAGSQLTRKRDAIPRAVQALVWKRDGGQCTFKDATGRRCSARRRLEYDHVIPFAAGGKDTLENLRLRCRLHNKLAAIEAFGKKWMSQWNGPPAMRRN
jgi:hypothetical protein